MDAKDGTAILSVELQRQSLDPNTQQQQQISSSSSTLTEIAPMSSSVSTSATDKTLQGMQSTVQRQPSLSTPEAHWSASSNFSLAPELTLSSSEALDQNSFFDNLARPYTPSYNSTFEGALSDQEEYWSGAGSHFEGVDFDFGEELYKGQATSSTFAYDPETADNYNNLDSALLAAQAFTDHSNINHSSSSSSATSSGLSVQQPSLQSIPPQTPSKDQIEAPLPIVSISDQSTFRDPIEKSPFASPQLGATSPLHTRHSSFGSNIGSPAPALDQEQNWMQSLGQRMSLGDDTSKYPRQYYQQPMQQGYSSHQHQQQPYHQNQHQQFFAPVFEEEGAEQPGIEQQEQHQSIDDRTYPSYTYTQSAETALSEGSSQERSQAEASQLPLLSISDTTMQDAAFSGAAVASSKLADGKGWLPNAPSDWTQSQEHYYPLAFSNNPDHSSWSQLSHPSQQQQQQPQQAPTPSSTRPVNEGGVQQPKRQDSYDPIRKFLRLDVDMGFVSQQQNQQMHPHPGGHEVNNWAAVRKRSNSDFGPAYFGIKEGDMSAANAGSPPMFTVVPGGVTDKTPTAMTSGVDWVTEAARQRKMQAQAYGAMQQQNTYNSSNPVVMTMQQPQNGHTMDPVLLQQYTSPHMVSQQQPRYNPASGPIRQRDMSNMRGAAALPYSHSRTSSSGGSANATPWAPVSPTIHEASLPAYRPTSVSRSNSASRHRRLAQSEDLSQLARSSNPTEFLHRITAPDGSLAPPNTRSQAPPLSSFAHGSPFHSNGGSGNGISNGRMNPYRTSHDRHHSTSSNPSNASSPGSNDAALTRQYSNEGDRPTAGSMNPPITTRSGSRAYSQTALPTYSSLGSSTGEQTMVGLDGSSFHVPVVQVTTSATQAASASRRKNEAIHVCPIPGCGSTFTRKFNLNGHIRSHTGSRPYECREPGCGKSFARSFDLSRHEKLHAGIKPHNCENCGKAFARADALSRHLRNDAGNGGCSAKTIEEGDEEAAAALEEEEEAAANAAVASVAATGGMTAPRMRNGSSASSSLDSMDEIDRERQERIRRQQGDQEKVSGIKKESRFKGYIL